MLGAVLVVALSGCAAGSLPSTNASQIPTTSRAPAASGTPPLSAEPSATPTHAASTAPWIVYQSTTPTGTPLRLVRPDGSDDHLLMAEPPGSDQGHPAWSTDGTTIGFEAWLNLPDPTPAIELWTVKVDGSELRRLASCELPCLQLAYPAWSPDGTRIGWMRYDIEPDETWGRSTVEVLDVATGEREIVASTTDGTSAYYNPHWSPGGEQLVVVVQDYADATQSEVLDSFAGVMDARAGSTVERLTPEGLYVDDAEWAPGTSIVLTAADSKATLESTARVMIISPNGDGLRELVNPPEQGAVAFDPTWVNRGLRVMVTTAGPSAPERIAFVDPDGGAIQHASWTLRSVPGIQRMYAHQQPTR